MKGFQIIRRSFTIQLTLWVAGFVMVISGVVILLLARFSQQVIREESLETTQQALKNTVVTIDNRLRQADMTARLENRTFKADKALIEKLIKESGFPISLKQSLPHAHLYVSDRPEAGRPSDYQHLSHQGKESYLFYEPVYDQQFSITISCPKNDLYGHFFKKQVILVMTGIIGVLLLLFICWKVIAWHLRPLHKLADAAQNIADGHLDETIPDSRQKDEIGRLQSSLSKMQRSLVSYMEEMQQKQETLSKQNAELQEAYSMAQEYEDLKASFLHHMTGQMAVPVETICQHTDTLCANYQHLSKAEMATIQSDILAATGTVTQLLDQLLNVPSQNRPHHIITNPKPNAES